MPLYPDVLITEIITYLQSKNAIWLSSKWEFLLINDFIMDNVTDYGPGTMGTVKLILDLKLFKNPSKMIYYKLMQPIQYSVMRQLSNSWNWNVELIVKSLHRNDFELKMHFPKL